MAALDPGCCAWAFPIVAIGLLFLVVPECLIAVASLLASVVAAGRLNSCGAWASFLCHMQDLPCIMWVLLVVACRIRLPDQRWNSGPLHWEC